MKPKRISWNRRLAALLAAFFCLSALLGACSGSRPEDASEEEASSGTETADPYAGTFRVGYARIDITPSKSVPLRGFGNTTQRMSNGYLDPTYATCIVFTDEEEHSFFWYAIDICQIDPAFAKSTQEALLETLGIPEDHVILTASHTHSNIDTSQTTLDVVNEWRKEYQTKLVQVANEALADRHPATLFWTEADLTGYNSVRHYFTDVEGDPAVGDNHGMLAVGQVVRHTTEANSMMYLLRVKREGAKDIVLANWRAHPTTASVGGNARKDVSADFIGTVRYYLEKDMDVLYAYYQGEAGNINPRTRLGADVEFNPPTDYKEYGRALTELIEEALNGEMTEVKTGPIRTVRYVMQAAVDHSRDEYASIAQELYNGWLAGKMTATEVARRGQEYSIDSPYEASAIVSHRNAKATQDVELHATLIGDFALVSSPGEPFDTAGTSVREQSPAKYLFIQGYSNGGGGYIPSKFAYEYGCYEADTTPYLPGTAEEIAKKQLELLNGLWNER